MTDADKAEAAEDFLEILRRRSVCSIEWSCQLSDVEVSCGLEADDSDFFGDWDFDFRKRRSNRESLKFSLKVVSSTKPVLALDCSSFCGSNDSFTNDCLQACGAHFDLEQNRTVSDTAEKITQLFHERETRADLAVTVSDAKLYPMRGVRLQPIQLTCGSGISVSNTTGFCGMFTSL